MDVVPAAQAGPSALVMTSRQDLLDRLGRDRLAPEDYETVAAGLDTETTNLGG